MPAVRLAAVVLATLVFAPAANAALPAPTGLKPFLLRADEAPARTFPRTPSFAWRPVRGAVRYEFELATKSKFAESSIVWRSDSLKTPTTAIPVALPWMTGSPYALWAHVRAFKRKGATRWSAPYGFDMRWTDLPARSPAPRGSSAGAPSRAQRATRCGSSGRGSGSRRRPTSPTSASTGPSTRTRRGRPPSDDGRARPPGHIVGARQDPRRSAGGRQVRRRRRQAGERVFRRPCSCQRERVAEGRRRRYDRRQRRDPAIRRGQGRGRRALAAARRPLGQRLARAPLLLHGRPRRDLRLRRRWEARVLGHRTAAGRVRSRSGLHVRQGERSGGRDLGRGTLRLRDEHERPPVHGDSHAPGGLRGTARRVEAGARRRPLRGAVEPQGLPLEEDGVDRDTRDVHEPPADDRPLVLPRPRHLAGASSGRSADELVAPGRDPRREAGLQDRSPAATDTMRRQHLRPAFAKRHRALCVRSR